MDRAVTAGDRQARTPSAIALVPARAGSKRVPHKNVRLLAGHPLMAYSIQAARASGIFASVVVSTDSPQYAEIAKHYGAEVPYLRPAAISGDLSPDIEWIEDLLRRLAAMGRNYDCFSILRPTSPFRTAETIKRAWKTFCAETGVDSLRAVEKCKQHPGKMWVVRDARMLPLMPLTPADRPWHSSQYQALPEVFVQNASLEIARSATVLDKGSIAGETIVPFLTEAAEGLDVNDEKDWWYAEWLLANGAVALPQINKKPMEFET
jgi:CMP-N,N'-diacetyllegionaminic acid synthase